MEYLYKKNVNLKQEKSTKSIKLIRQRTKILNRGQLAITKDFRHSNKGNRIGNTKNSDILNFF